MHDVLYGRYLWELYIPGALKYFVPGHNDERNSFRDATSQKARRLICTTATSVGWRMHNSAVLTHPPDKYLRAKLPCQGRTPQEPLIVAKLIAIKHEFFGKLPSFSPRIIQRLFLVLSSNA